MSKKQKFIIAILAFLALIVLVLKKIGISNITTWSIDDVSTAKPTNQEQAVPNSRPAPTSTTGNNTVVNNRPSTGGFQAPPRDSPKPTNPYIDNIGFVRPAAILRQAKETVKRVAQKGAVSSALIRKPVDEQLKENSVLDFHQWGKR